MHDEHPAQHPDAHSTERPTGSPTGHPAVRRGADPAVGALRLSRRRGIAAVSLLGLTALTGCATAAESDGASDGGAASGRSDAGGSAAQREGTWPRTVRIREANVTLEAAPTRIVAVSTETADMALQLVGSSRVIAVPDGMADPHASNQSELAAKVEETVQGAPAPDPESILSLDPDLVLLTERHEGEKSVGESITASGVPCAAFTAADFETPETVAAALTTMGGLLGAESAAEDAVRRMDERIATVEKEVEGADDAPRVLGLFARGGKQMLFAAGSSTSTLIGLAAGTSIAEEAGWDASPSADPEVILDASPDVILVQDFHGGGLGPFRELLDRSALADVPAIAEDRVHLIDAMTTSGTAGARLGEGVEQIAAILHPDLVTSAQ
jgi:iron complex transport system substrate-binding protein